MKCFLMFLMVEMVVFSIRPTYQQISPNLYHLLAQTRNGYQRCGARCVYLELPAPHPTLVCFIIKCKLGTEMFRESSTCRCRPSRYKLGPKSLLIPQRNTDAETILARNQDIHLIEE